MCCFLQYKKLAELPTAIFDLSINIFVVLWFKSTSTILEITGCTLAKYQYRDKDNKAYLDCKIVTLTDIGVARILDWGGGQTTNHMQ